MRALSLGLCDAPAILIYQVYDALRGLTDECASVCLGDILVYSSNTASRRKHLWMVLD